MKRLGLRFLVVYLGLILLPDLTGADWLTALANRAWHPLIVWVGAHVFHLRITVFSNGSGDTTYDYLRVATNAALAALVAPVWSALDRRTDDRALLAWTRIFLRYVLALEMLEYGADKVFTLQFGELSYAAVTEPLGEHTPMMLLWRFMAFSPAYTIFGGTVEVLGGALLFFRRTTTLGALIVISVMTNVVMLNLCYDVPVKLFASHLLFIAVFLAAGDARRLVNVLVLNRPTAPIDLEAPFTRRRTALAVKSVLVGYMVYATLWTCFRHHRENVAPQAAPQGTYEITSFMRDGHEAADAPTDEPRRWKLFRMKRGYVRVWYADRSSVVFKVKGDPNAERLELLPSDDDGEVAAGAPVAGELHVSVSPQGEGRVTGKLLGHDLAVAMSRRDPGDAPLLKRGFHWINEAPFMH